MHSNYAKDFKKCIINKNYVLELTKIFLVNAENMKLKCVKAMPQKKRKKNVFHTWRYIVFTHV